MIPVDPMTLRQNEENLRYCGCRYSTLHGNVWKVDLDAPSRSVGILLPNTQILGGSSRSTKVLTISLSHQRLRPYDESPS